MDRSDHRPITVVDISFEISWISVSFEDTAAGCGIGSAWHFDLLVAEGWSWFIKAGEELRLQMGMEVVIVASCVTFWVFQVIQMDS